MFKNFNLKKIFLNRENILLLLLFAVFLFTRFYQLSDRMSFGFDQVQGAWASKQIIIDHSFPLLGPVAKASGGFSVGPFYYYALSFFYFIFNLNPIASAVFASFVSIITFWILFLCIKDIFNFKVAFIAVVLDTISYIVMDRTDWNASFIVPISMLMFYLSYKILIDKSKKYLLIWLGLVLGISFSVHFTSVFYPILLLLLIPFLSWDKKTIFYSFIALIITLICLSPVIIYDISSKNSETNGITSYLAIYYHGIHLVRIMQLLHDGFIEFAAIFRFSKIADYFDYLLVPIFSIVYLYKKLNKNRIILVYMISIWFLVPWIAFSTYAGELTNYYFWITRPAALIVLSYLLYKIFEIKNIFPKIIVILFLAYLSYLDFYDFFASIPSFEYKREKANVFLDIKNNNKTPYNIHAGESYIYYYYEYLKIK